MKRLILLLVLIGFAVPARATDVQEITSPQGLKVWLVEDHHLPILSLAFAFRGGISLDPAGKAGLAHFVSGVLDEGAGPRDSETFQTVLADNAISLSFTAQRDSFDGAIRTLTQHRDIAAELLHDALTSPHLDPKDVDRIRDSIFAEIKQNMSDPNWVAQRNFNNTVFQGHVYGQPGHGSLDSIGAITPDDLKAYIHDHFGRDQLLITATGDISAQDLGTLVDRIFADLPAKAAPYDVPEAQLHAAGETFVINKPIPESVLLMGAAGPKRDDADWYASEIMNYVLGGGGFNSRLMDVVRVKNALTYGIGSSLVPYQHAGLIIVSGSTKNEDAGKALALVKTELARMQAGGITETELKEAKTYLTGSIPLELTSTERIAEVLLSIHLDHLPIDFLNTIGQKLNAVTAADVRRAAKRFLAPDAFTTIVLGRPQDIKATGNLPQ